MRKLALVAILLLILHPAFADTQLKVVTATDKSPYGSYYTPSAIDGSLITYWFVYTDLPAWLKLDLGKSCSLSKISIFWKQYFGSPNYDIQGSNDNLNWANLYTGLSSAMVKLDPYQQDYPLSGAYRYIRLNINQMEMVLPVIYEVKLYGSADTAVTPAPQQPAPIKPGQPARISSVSPQDGATFLENELISINAVLADTTGAGQVDYQFSVDGAIRKSWQRAASYTLSGLSSGTHKLKAEVKNNSGQDTKEAEVYIFRSPIAPP